MSKATESYECVIVLNDMDGDEISANVNLSPEGIKADVNRYMNLNSNIQAVALVAAGYALATSERLKDIFVQALKKANEAAGQDPLDHDKLRMQNGSTSPDELPF